MPTGTKATAPGPRRWRWLGPIALAALALAVTAPEFGNSFTQDDLPLIYRNETVHGPSGPGKFFSQSYWHDPFPPALYRPLAVASLALQWRAGGGEPNVFRWVSAGLLAASAIALFALAVQCLPLVAAWAAAALFVVHPVHVEATALGVNQGELVVGLLLCWAGSVYLRARKRGDLSPSAGSAIVLLYVGAGLFKENALVLPLLLLAAEFTVIEDARALGIRVRRLRPFYLALGLGAALVLAARSAVLGGDVVGTFGAEALIGAGSGERALTMLGVVPEWARLLLWPRHLQADYGPNEIVAATGFRLAQWAGAVWFLAWAVGVLLARRRNRPLAFGLLWTAIALLPVSNVLFPIGVILAERTLFLATVGVAIAAGAALSLVRSGRDEPGGHAARWAGALVLLALLGLGVARSRTRAAVWRDPATLLRRTVVDAPRSYTAHLALTRLFEDTDSAEAARAEYRAAVTQKPMLVAQDRALADQYRMAGLCRPAVRLYRRVLVIAPGDPGLVASLDACDRALRADSAMRGPPR